MESIALVTVDNIVIALYGGKWQLFIMMSSE